MQNPFYPRKEEQHDKQEEHLEKEELRLIREEVRLLREILRAIRGIPNPPTLSSIKVILSGGSTMPVGPLTIAVGQPYVATVVGFDQNGQPFLGVIPPATFSDDNTAVAVTDPTAGTGTGLSAGADNISGKVTSAEGLVLSDTETLTVTATPPPPQVLTSIKVALDTPATATAAVRR